jgi:SPP1 gp7 family putative phage head morphogenesis protein
MNTLRLDPTRTTLLRKQFAADMKSRFVALRRAILKKVGEEDAFGLDAKMALPPLGPIHVPNFSKLNLNTEWQGETDEAKIEEYKKWFEAAVAIGILAYLASRRPWLEKYIGSAYRRGVNDAYTAVHRADMASSRTSDFLEGGKASFMQTSFGGQATEAQIRKISNRAFTSLNGITAQMSSDMSRILSQGLANGKGAKALARELAENVDNMTRKRALKIVSTEINASYNEAQLDAFEVMGVDVMAQIETMRDGRVCPVCSSLHGMVFTVAEARGILPLHPDCRCRWVAVLRNKRGR